MESLQLIFKIQVVLLIIFSNSCAQFKSNSQSVQFEKITFDINKINDEGLTGPPGGLRAVSYEFCIPDSPEKKSKVASIDTTVKFFASSPGRIGCGQDQLLCIGSTNQANYRDVLKSLNALEYVEQIDECFFE